MAADDPRDLPLSEIVSRLTEQTSRLVRQEIELARSELGGQAKAVGAAAGIIGTAALLVLGAFGALTAAIVGALAVVLPMWAAALIVTVLYAVGAGICAYAARERLRRVDPVPRQTIQTVKEDARWVATRAKSGRT
jgi:uncharacterized membrane protein YqjE